MKQWTISRKPKYIKKLDISSPPRGGGPSRINKFWDLQRLYVKKYIIINIFKK